MKRRSRAIVIASVVAGVCVVALALGGWWARGVASAANSGKAHVEAGAKRLAAQDATDAAALFGAASRDFSRARTMLGPQSLGNVVVAIPLAGRQYSAARTLVTIGLDGSTAGTELAAVLREAQSTSTSSTSTATLGLLLTSARPHVDAALIALNAASDRAAQLPDSGLIAPLAKPVRSVKALLRAEGPLLGRARALLSLERYLLSSEHRILVISQDSAQIRPTGGFVGSYGIIDVGPKGVKLEAYKDVYSLPNPPGRVAPPRGAVMTKDFGFRDANWWMDFPTSARAMLAFWRASRQPPVDGIVAVDIVTMKELLGALGPVSVPGHAVTFTSQNLLNRLLYLVDVKGAGDKGVLITLANQFEQRVLSAGPAEIARAAIALAKAGDAKHVQLYFPSPEVEAAVTALGWSGAIAPTKGTTDLLAVSNAMNRGGKVNLAMKKTITYAVALKPDGSAVTTLVLGYSNTAPFPFPESVWNAFWDYLRVYRAPGTALSSGAGRLRHRSTMTVDTGLPTVVREFSVPRGQRRPVTVVTRVPGAWRGSDYRLLIVRQADLEDIPTTVSVMAPAGWRVSSVSAWKTASHTALPASNGGSGARLALPLSGDVVFDVGLQRN